MKKMLVLCGMLLLPGQLSAATPPADKTGELDWSIKKSWKLSAKPIDFVQSLDNKMVYVLEEDNKVHIYSIDGKEMGTVPVDKTTTAIDIAPRGEMLYLVNSSNTYTAIDISFTKTIDISGAPFLGNENAPVTMVVFSDFQ
jgi:DNA-binding beta-propeller fold protein YncE